MFNIGVFGTGLMGKEMCFSLVSANYSVIAYNRTQAKLTPLKEAGIKTTNSSQKAIADANCLILMLTNAKAIEEVLLSSKPNLKDKTIIQMGTISPDESKLIQSKVNQLQGDYFEAPVLGSIPQVKTGDLLVMVGGKEKQFQRWQKLLKVFGPQPMLIGEVGTASALKLALNQLIAGLTTTFALSLHLIQKEGVDTEKFMEILRESALYAPTFDKKLSRMCDHNYANPNFPTKHLLKDIDLFLTQAKELNLNTASLEGIRQIVAKSIELGLSDADYSAIFEAI